MYYDWVSLKSHLKVNGPPKVEEEKMIEESRKRSSWDIKGKTK